MSNQSETRRRQRKNRNERGLCSNCPNQLGRSKVMCDVCLAKLKANSDRRIAYRKANGLCRRCSQPSVDGYNECQVHLDDQKVRRKRRLARGNCAYCNKQSNGKTICSDCSIRRAEERSKRKAVGLCVSPGCQNDARYGKVNCLECAKRLSDETRRLKQVVLDHYGQKCNCLCNCQVTKFEHLTMDHKNNDGAKQRKEKKHHSGRAEYARIIRERFPNDMQVLCWNCNCAKAYYGGCK